MKETPETPAVVYGENNNNTLSPAEALNILQQPDIGKISFHRAISPQPGQMFLYSGEENIQWQKDGHDWLNCGKRDVPKAKPVCSKACYMENLPSDGFSHLWRDVFTAFETDNKLILVHYLAVYYTGRRFIQRGQQILGDLSEERATKKQRQQKKSCLEKQKLNRQRRPVSRVEVQQHSIMKETPETPSAVVYGEKSDYLSITEALYILQQPNIDKISFTTAVSPQPGQMFLYSDEVNIQWQKDGHKWKNCGKHGIPTARPVCWKAYYRENLPAGGMSSFFRDVFTAVETDNKLTLVHYVLNNKKSRNFVAKNGKQIKMEENGFERKAFETQSALVVAQSPMEGAACRKDDIDSQISGNLPEETATKSPMLTMKKRRRRRKKRCWEFKNERNRKRGTVPRKTTPVASTSSKTAPVGPTCRRTTLPTPLEDKWQSHKLLQPTVKIEPLKMELIKQEKELQQETDPTNQNTDAEDEWQRKLISYIIGGGASFTNTPVKTTSEVLPADRTTTVFTCFKCGLQFHQRFRLQGHLKWHERTVMKSILYTCENCGLHYKQLSCLKSHIALVHVSRWVSKRGSRGRNRGRPSFGHRPKEENRRQCEESREEIYEDRGVNGKQGDEEADQENYLRLTVEGSDQENYLHEQENYLHHTVEENDCARGSQCSGEESNKKSDHHQQNTDEEIAHDHIGGRNNLDHECLDVGNDQLHAESEAEIGLENDEEHGRHHEDMINEETDEICDEDVDYIIEQNDQSSEDDEHADDENVQSENDECFNDEKRDDRGSILTFKPTDQLGREETNHKTTASVTTEIDPQPIERRSTRISKRMSSNTTVDQIRCQGDGQQSKESPGSHGNRGRKRSHGEQSAERNDVRKKCEELNCPDCGLKCTHKADLLRHKCAEKGLHCQVCRRQYASHQDLLKHVSEEHVVSPPPTNENDDDQIETHRVEVRQHGIMKETPETPSAVVYGEKNDYLSITEALNILQQPNIDKISFTTAVSPQPGQMFLYSDEVNVQWRKDGHKWEHCGKHKVPKARPGCWKAYYREKLPAGGMSSFFRHVFTAFETDNKLTLVHYVLNDQKSLRLVVNNEKQVLGDLSEERATKKQRQQKKGCLEKKKRNRKGRPVSRSVTDDFHTDAGEIPTDICSQVTTAENSGDQPEVRRTSLKPFKCRMCANAFASQHDLQNHEVVHSKEKPVSKPFQCRTCHKAFSTAQGLRIHSKRHVNSRNSVRHKSERKLLEELNSTMSLNCCECDKIFKTSGNLRRHVLLHNMRRLQHACRAADGECAFLMFKDYVKKFRGYGCHLCEKAFLWPGQLRVHVMVHTGEKLYHCSQCEAGFLYGGNFRQHMRTHTGEKPHCCDVCGKRFAQSSNLKAHRTMHMNEKPFKCNDCSKGFRRLSQLKSHQELYQKDKYMYRVHQERILNARKMHELTEKAGAEEGGVKELVNRTDDEGPSIVEQYDYDTDDEEQE